MQVSAIVDEHPPGDPIYPWTRFVLIATCIADLMPGAIIIVSKINANGMNTSEALLYAEAGIDP